jgi:hypothetical protein
MRIGLSLGIAAVAASIGIAGADEFKPPPMKDGLWETHSAETQQGKIVFQTSLKMCQSKEITKSNQAMGNDVRKQNQCTSVVSQPSANTIVEESRCTKGPNAGSVTRLVYTHQGDTASHTEIHMKVGQTESVTITDTKYLGSCPADMKPGDVITSKGTKISVSESK